MGIPLENKPKSPRCSANRVVKAYRPTRSNHAGAAQVQPSRKALTFVHLYILIFINTVFYTRNCGTMSFQAGFLPTKACQGFCLDLELLFCFLLGVPTLSSAAWAGVRPDPAHSPWEWWEGDHMKSCSTTFKGEKLKCEAGSAVNSPGRWAVIAHPWLTACPGRTGRAGHPCSGRRCGSCPAAGTSRSAFCPSPWTRSRCPRWWRSPCRWGSPAAPCSAWGKQAGALLRRPSSPWARSTPCTLCYGGEKRRQQQRNPHWCQVCPWETWPVQGADWSGSVGRCWGTARTVSLLPHTPLQPKPVPKDRQVPQTSSPQALP